MAQPFHCPGCSRQLPASFAFKVSPGARLTCPHCSTKIRPDREKRSLHGKAAGGFLAAITLVLGHVYMIVRHSDPLITYGVMIGIALFVFVFFSVVTARKVVFEKAPNQS